MKFSRKLNSSNSTSFFTALCYAFKTKSIHKTPLSVNYKTVEMAERKVNEKKKKNGNKMKKAKKIK